MRAPVRAVLAYVIFVLVAATHSSSLQERSRRPYDVGLAPPAGPTARADSSVDRLEPDNPLTEERRETADEEKRSSTGGSPATAAGTPARAPVTTSSLPPPRTDREPTEVERLTTRHRSHP